MNQDSQRILEEVLKLQEIMNNYFEAACAYKARLGLVLQTLYDLQNRISELEKKNNHSIEKLQNHP